MQMGYFLKAAGRSHVLFERGSNVSTFFRSYPRHRRLISVNKRYTGSSNPEFNLRHDWHSLLSNDSSLLFPKRSKNMYPWADELVAYLEAFQAKQQINIRFNTDIKKISRSQDANKLFNLVDQHSRNYTCKVVIVGTGWTLPNIPKMKGMELTVGYETMSVNPEDYEGKSVLILGKGNSAFEVSQAISSSVNYVHLLSRHRIRVAWQTHYVGDVRAVNDGLLDVYQLKSLDGVVEGDVEQLELSRLPDGRIQVKEIENQDENFPLRFPYDIVIRSLGFRFDYSIFDQATVRVGADPMVQKFPAYTNSYESVSVPDLYFIGTLSHAKDFRRSSGGFVHGFRYLIRTVFRFMEERYHSVAYPRTVVPIGQLHKTFLKRMNECSGPFQMFALLVDVAVLVNETHAEYYEELILKEVPARFPRSKLLVFEFDYGANFSCPGCDTLRENRAADELSMAAESNFLHPIMRFYDFSQRTEESVAKALPRANAALMARPVDTLHLLEDFHTDFTNENIYVRPLVEFIQRHTSSSTMHEKRHVRQDL